MYLKYVQIVNYKNLRKARFEFGKGANTVIGENDSGKSNAMTAMRILLDDDYFYNTKRLKESDFSESLGDWRGHWIIISAFFDQITDEDQQSEVCTQISPEVEDEDFLKSFIRCEGNNYGVVTLFIRPNKKQRKALFEAQTKSDFDNVRNNISLLDYEFLYTVRSQADFTNEEVYTEIVGDFEAGDAPNPDDEDSYIIGTKVDILDIWKHISLEFIDALRDAQGELRKPKNPLRRIFDVVNQEIDSNTIEEIKDKIRELNQSLSGIPQIKNIGNDVNKKLNDIVGLVYSPEICVESHIREEIESIARNLTVVPADEDDIEQLGLGHLNILYIALKLVEFEVSRNHEVLNIMIVEEPEAHIHTHIQRTLFENLNIKENYTQVIMTTHSTHLSEVSNIAKMNVLMRRGNQAIVMRPTNGLQEFAEESFGISDLSIERCIERYLDAKRSVLLFSKAVILVEGDGEELLIPSLVKQCFGVSLDELGIGLINVGSVTFEYIACVIKSEKCSICGKRVLLRKPCGHKLGKLYMGKQCQHVITDLEMKAIAIVTQPFDKYTYLRIPDKEYDYGMVKMLISEINNPYESFWIETVKKKKPEYEKIGRNSICPCGSGLKYKKCHLGNPDELMDHNIVHLTHPAKKKYNGIQYFGTWKS